MQVVSQVIHGAIVHIDVYVTFVPAEWPSTSVPAEGPSISVIFEGHSTTSTSSQRPQDNSESSSQIPPPADVVGLVLPLMCLF